MLFVIIGLLFLVILLTGLFSDEARRERRRRELIERGDRVRAKVVAAQATGTKRGGLAEVEVDLELEDGRRARAREAMTPAEQTRCRPGASVRAAVATNGDELRAVVTRYR